MVIVVLVMLIFSIIRRTLLSNRMRTIRRGAYKDLYQHLERRFPHTWSQRGPLENVQITNRWDHIKWFFIKYWFGADKVYDDQDDPLKEALGVSHRIKWRLTVRWLWSISKGAAGKGV